jgi:prevent-host-death family protein
MYKIHIFVQNTFPMRSIPLSEFRANASAMLDLVEAGESLRILRHGKPVAEIVPPRPVELKVPSWKRPITPLNIVRADGKTGAQLIIEERESGW